MREKQNVPKLRFPGFTDEWEQCRLIDIANYVRGSFPQPYNNPEWFDELNGMPFVQVADIGFDLKLFAQTKLKISKIAESKSRFVKEGTVIVALQGSIEKSIGRVAITQYPSFIDRTILIFESYKIPMNKGLFAQLIQRLFQVEKERAWGATISTITKEVVNDFILTLPKIEEQNRLGEMFIELDRILLLHQQKLEHLQEQKKGLLQKMFPRAGESIPKVRFLEFDKEWEKLTILEAVDGKISDGDWIEKEHIFDEGEYRIIQTGNLGIGDYQNKPKSAKYFHQENFDELKANEIYSGDILISRLANPAGRTIILPETGFRMVTAVDVAVIRPNNKFDSYFFKTIMNSEKMLYEIRKKVTGTTHKRISRKNLEQISFLIPGIDEQIAIGTFFRQLDDLITLHQRKIGNLKQQKKGLLQQMFV